MQAKKYVSRTTEDPSAIFADDPDLQLPEEDEDAVRHFLNHILNFFLNFAFRFCYSKPPSDFSGDVMQAKILGLSNRNNGKGKFRYA